MNNINQHTVNMKQTCARDGVCKLFMVTHISYYQHFALRSNRDSIAYIFMWSIIVNKLGPITTSSQGDVAIGIGGGQVNHLCFQPFLN